MISTKKALAYRGFGLNIFSEISLPELIPVSERIDKADILIEISDLASKWSEVGGKTKRFDVKKNEIMFEVPNTAIFSIKEGKKIIVSPIMDAEEDRIRLYILGTCMGALLIQRKTLPLHGSAVAINGSAYAFVGESGAGKSTLAAALIKEGYKLLSDDVIPVVLSEDNLPYVIPSYPHQKLWQESLSEFGMETKGFRPLFDRETKFAVPVNSEFSNETLPLAGVFELVKTENECVEIKKIDGLERFLTLFTHTYRNFLITRLEIKDWHFKESVKILNQIIMFQLRRPLNGFTVNNLVENILAAINKEERK